MRSYRFAACLLLLASAASDLYADGCFVWNKGADLNEPSQKAVISWRNGTEVMILQVKYEGPAEDFAWIIPLPAPPKLHAVEADKSPFAEISLYTQQRARWGLRGREEADREQKQGVTVLQRKVVGVYDIAVLAADDAGALSGWLNKNGYAFPKDRNDVLEHYTKKRWVYAAMRIDRKALHSDEIKKLKTGELQPVRFTFAARQMVYPLRISSVNAGETEVLLYLLADAPMVLSADRRPPEFVVEQNIPRFLDQWCTDPEYGTYRKVTGKELPLTWESLGLKKETALSLCKYRCLYKTERMIDDLAFAPFKPLPYWETRLESEPDWRRKLAIAELLMRHDTWS